MKLWVDDIREAPKGWVWAKDALEATDYLLTNEVTHISLDHDLGDDDLGTGYDVLNWLELEVHDGKIKCPKISLHTANPVGRMRMEQVIRKMGSW